MLGQFLQNCNEPLFPTVAHGDGYVAKKADKSRAFDRCATKGFTKLLQVETGQPLQLRIHKCPQGLKFSNAGNGRAPVPWTDVLADVATEHLPSNAGAKFLRYPAALFDCQVRNALR